MIKIDIVQEFFNILSCEFNEHIIMCYRVELFNVYESSF